MVLFHLLYTLGNPLFHILVIEKGQTSGVTF